jgi:hypothetical protein
MANNLEQDKNFKKVRFYQDKILLETELNELQDIQNRRFEDHVYDSLGNVIISGFNVVDSGELWEISVNLGKAYIQGKVVTNNGTVDSLDIVTPAQYEGDLTLYVILKPLNTIYTPTSEGDKGWEYGVGEPTTYRTEESYEVVIASDTEIIIGDTVYAININALDSSNYIELARILRPDAAIGIGDCTIRDTRINLISKLGDIVNKNFYMKAEQTYNTAADMKSPNELKIVAGSDTADERDRICADLDVCNAEVVSFSNSYDDSISNVYDEIGNKVVVTGITTQINGETLSEAVATLSGDVPETVYVPIVGESNLLLGDNCGFEDGTSNPNQWTNNGAPIFDVSGNKSYSDNYAVGVSNNNSYKSENFINVVAETKYIITAFLMADSINSLNYQFIIEWYNSLDVLISTEIKEIVVATNYKKYIALISSPALAVKAKIMLNGDSSTINIFWVDNVELISNISTSNLLMTNVDFQTSDGNVIDPQPINWEKIGLPIYNLNSVQVNSTNYYRYNTFVSVNTNTEYIVAADIKYDGTTDKCRILVEWYDSNYNLIDSSYENIIVTASSINYYIRIISPSNNVAYAKIVLDGNGINEDLFSYDNIGFYEYNITAISLIVSNNPNFENGNYILEKWDIVGAPIYSTSSFDSYNGHDVVKVNSDNSYISNSFIGVIGGSSYRISAYIKAVLGLSYQFKINWYDSSNVLISTSVKSVVVTTESFNYCTAVFIAPSNAVYLKVVLDGDGVSSLNDFWVDNISILKVTVHEQFPIVLHYGYGYTLANLPANFAMADIVSGVSIDMAIQEILGNRYFDGSLPISSDGTNSVDRRLVDLWDELHSHRHKGLISPRLEARDIDLLNPPRDTTQATVEDHITTNGTGKPDDNNPHGLSAKNIDLNLDETPYRIIPKTSIHGEVTPSLADHILEIGTGIPNSKNPHGLDSSDIIHNSETNPDNSYKTIEQALFDRIKDLHGDGVIRGLKVFAKGDGDAYITDGYAYINGKRIRVGNSIIVQDIILETETSKTFRISGALVNDIIYVIYFDEDNYYTWETKAELGVGYVQVLINNSYLIENHKNIPIISYNNLIWDNNENFEMQLSHPYRDLNILSLTNTNDRIDIVSLDSNGIISVIQGLTDGSKGKAIIPNNSIKLAEVYVDYNGTAEDIINYADIGDYRYKIDWRHNGGGSGNIGSNDQVISNTGILGDSLWRRLQLLDTTIEYYKQIFISAADIGTSLSRMAVETFINNSNIDESESNNVRLDDSNIYLGADDQPLQSMDLVADWRNFSEGGGIGTWVSKSYIGEHTIGIANLIGAKNPSFEDGTPDFWVATGAPTLDTDSYVGLKAAKVSFGNTYTSLDNIFVGDYVGSTPVVLSNKKSFKFSAYIKATTISITCRVLAKWYDATGTLMVITDAEGTNLASISTDNRRYKKYETVLVAPIGAMYLKITLDGDGSNAANWFLYDNLELVELDNIATVLFFVRETLNNGNNTITYYVANDNEVTWEEATPNTIHTFNNTGSELRVKIVFNVISNDNEDNEQPRVHSFSLVWGIGQGHNHDGINSSNILGNPEGSLTLNGIININSPALSIADLMNFLNLLQQPIQPSFIGEYKQNSFTYDSIINGPGDMRMKINDNLFSTLYIANAYIPADAILLPDTDIVVGTAHDGVVNISSPINIDFYVYPADRGFIEITINGVVLATLNLTSLWSDVVYTNIDIIDQFPRILTEQIDYPISGGVHGEGIALTERMSFVPPQTGKTNSYYQTAKCSFVFDPNDWLNGNGEYGEEELGKIRLSYYDNYEVGTRIEMYFEETKSLFNDIY